MAVPSVLQSQSSSKFFFTGSILKSSTDSLNRWESGLLEIEVFTFAFSLCHHRHHHQQLVDKEGNIRQDDKINALIDQSVQGVNNGKNNWWGANEGLCGLHAQSNDQLEQCIIIRQRASWTRIRPQNMGQLSHLPKTSWPWLGYHERLIIGRSACLQLYQIRKGQYRKKDLKWILEVDRPSARPVHVAKARKL